MSNVIKNAIIINIGNAIDYFEFALFAYIAPIISKQFFSENNAKSLSLTLLIYASGFILRPIGGIVFGYIGDIYGRRSSLIATITIISLSCLTISILPTYKEIGQTSTIILLLVRLIQGFCMSGEYGGSIVLSFEQNKIKSEQIFSGVVSASSTILGCLSASIIAAKFLYENAENNWRLAFGFGFLVGVIGLYIRSSIPETIQISKVTEKKLIPISILLKYSKKKLLTAIFIFAITGITCGISTTFMNVYLYSYRGVPIYSSILLVSIYLVIYLISCLSVVFLTRKISIIQIIKMTILILSILSPLLLSYSTNSNLNLIFLTHIIFSIISGIIFGCANFIISDLFEADHRYTGVSLSDGIARSVIVGFVPLIGTYSINNFGDTVLLGWGLSVISFICFFMLNCTKPNANL